MGFPASFVPTQRAVHAVAEHVLCVVRYAAEQHVGLEATADGVATPPLDGRVVAVRGAELVDYTASAERRRPLTTLRDAGEFVGILPGAPALWTPVTPLDLDASLAVDPSSVAALADWYGRVGAALAVVAPDARPTLWPEHFDLAITVDDVTFGGSAGDEYHELPYAYVSLAADRRPNGTFWNAPFGAALRHEQIAETSDIAAFFTDAATRLGLTSA